MARLDAQANGFGNRFLWLCVRRSKVLPEGGQLTQTTVNVLAAQVAQAIAFARTVGEMHRDDAARDLWQHVYGDLTAERPGLSGALKGRAAVQVLRLACLYALFDGKAVVETAHLQAALALWQYAAESVDCTFGESTGDSLADQVMEHLQQHPDGLNRRTLLERFSGNNRADRLTRALRTLQELNLARRERQPTQGRPAEVWFPGPSLPAIQQIEQSRAG